ncbi:hypothetical protein BDN70DRAFT_995593 [Pholiota conissans]|uniref:MYND-type domain-containing protein n=1 Tax=Pholiota conissans TaxID=109636 RepID=A0A9P5YXL5_9AGAR|nr:hypothetical protein BDN70DRAFT_995593 [Pholiota conissans]
MLQSRILAAGPTSGEIKDVRQQIGVACTNCYKPGQDFKRCERCKTSYYCSRECQKSHWPKHKTFCKEIEGSAMKSLLENVIANKILFNSLQALLAIEFDLPNNPQLIRKPLMVRLDYVVEPANLEDLHSLLKSKSKDASGSIMGMFQLTNMISPRSGGSSAPLTPMRQSMWETARREVDEGGGYNTPVGLVELANNDSPQTQTFPLFIMPNALDMVKKMEPALIPTDGPAIVAKRISVHSYMEHINATIRHDTENRWLLRKKMRDSDKKMIRDVAAKNWKSYAALYFNEKMKREFVYKQT